jgi:hypothetical protein
MKKLTKMLTDFLEHRSESQNGGWPKVEDSDIEALSEIFREILKLKYEQDCDRSLPVEFRVIDRTKFERLQYFLIPYEHEAKTDDERLEILSRLSINSHMAADAVNHHVKMMELIRRFEKEEEGKKPV